ncbi:MAG: hypothetical protein HQ502_17280 [Alphaproteobacteria bacterium]|nr:hypothetical protein [Alphaproteobacteria bacterium]
MAAKPTTKTDTKTKKAESATPKPEAVKADTSTSEAPAATSDADSGSDGGSGGGSGGKKSSAPSRPISYFSSVSTDDYRAGWDDIFNAGGEKSAGKPVKSVAKRNSTLPANINLDADDLDAATREQLEAVFRQHAKKQRLNYDKLAKNGQVSWQISCRISTP